MRKPIKICTNSTSPLSIEDIVNDIVNSENYSTIKYRYSLMSEKDKNDAISIVLVSMRTYKRTPKIVKIVVLKELVHIIWKRW